MSQFGIRVITDEHIRRQQERYAMAKKKAKKKRLPKFPDANRDSRISQIREDLAALYDVAVEARDRAADMSAQPADRGRFPVLNQNGGQ